MRVYADRLEDHLSKQLEPVFLVFGSEPLLINESQQAITQQAKKQGFDEHFKYVINDSTNWQEIHDCCLSLSLFGSKKIIELDLPDSGVNASISKELLSLQQALSPDILLLLIGGKLTKAQENSKWFKSLHSIGCWVTCLTPDAGRLSQFVQFRCRKLGLSPDREATQMLAQWHEGNLTALVQSLEKLALNYPDGQLNLVRLEESLSRHNHFTAFHWTDALLAGKANRCQKILNQLQSEGTEPVVLLRTIQKELMLLSKMHDQLKKSNINQVFSQHKIWQSKKPLYSAALNRLTKQRLRNAISTLAYVELHSKTDFTFSAWPWLSQLSVQLCSTNDCLPFTPAKA
ncbi:DNA polymerase III subunit delta [Vibrio marisflavi]|uniref:DNA polymerase III subunit delta n=1 Tax=Vibrio marisflavi CECT 7928 TaxID=634439 RepID=A0ABM9A356_9VIBR|nr:DNA polymerase III subunit delta [Vibrio marisflavi]CAH0538994.1 DNA polymerase III subunit delta [Vibrio marisflavi CECT 7928]